MLKKMSDYTIPAETMHIVRKAFPKGTSTFARCDELGPIFQDEQFSKLYSLSRAGQHGVWRW
jgi:hypothetical protein